jgi:hypothetical protein
MCGSSVAAVIRLDSGAPVHTVAPDGAAAEVERALGEFDSLAWPSPDGPPVDTELGPFAATLVPLRTHLVA